MSFVPNFPPSLNRKVVEDAADGKKKSKEDFKKMKELEEARKLAVMPAMKDEEGRDINPHIPQYIMQAPWYFGAMQPTLSHQRQQKDDSQTSESINSWYKRGLPEETRRMKKYVKGACENCGSTTHKKKDCLERPRKIGAKFTNKDIAPDDYEQAKLELGFDAKRDRWNGYDPSAHAKLIEEHQKLEEARKLVKAKKLEDKITEAFKKPKGQQEPGASACPPMLEENEDNDDEDKYGEDIDMPGQKFDTKQRQSVRNLRIREDTAKYLFNLDPNSAFYDPKTRSMRENPFENTGKPADEVPFAGDNFIRYDGDAIELTKKQVFAWEMHGKLGLDVHLQADPTRMELLAQKITEVKTEVQSSINEDIFDKYGGKEHIDSLPKELLLGQWETYAEYSQTGRVLKGAEQPSVKSRFEEDILINNHTTIWGSYYHNGQWGYKCCRSLIKESYCLGEKNQLNETDAPGPVEPVAHKWPGMPGVANKTGEESEEDAETLEAQAALERIEQAKADAIRELEKVRSEKRREKKSNQRANKRKRQQENRRSKNKKKRAASTSSSSSSSSSSSLDSSSSSSSDSESENEAKKKERKVKAAMKKERERLKEVERLMSMDEKHRPYNSLAEVAMPTEEEMEAYHRMKKNTADPMSHF